MARAAELEAQALASHGAASRPAQGAGSLPTYGLSVVEVEAAAAVEVAGGKRKRLPRELLGLAMPDREWNVAMPFYTTAAKTREQFYSSATTQADAAAAREMHSMRASEGASSDAPPPDAQPESSLQPEATALDPGHEPAHASGSAAEHDGGANV